MPPTVTEQSDAWWLGFELTPAMVKSRDESMARMSFRAAKTLAREPKSPREDTSKGQPRDERGRWVSR